MLHVGINGELEQERNLPVFNLGVFISDERRERERKEGRKKKERQTLCLGSKSNFPVVLLAKRKTGVYI